MPFVEKRLGGPIQLGTSTQVVYTVPAGGQSAVIRQIVVSNVTASAATFTLYIGAESAANALFSASNVAANDTVIINLSQVLSTNEVVRVKASTNSALNFTMSGVENDGPLAQGATYIPNGAITSSKIADSSITAEKIVDGAVGTLEIANNAVTQAKLASSLSGVTVTTSTLRATAVPTPFEGQAIFETDTDRMLIWNGTAWVIPNAPAQNPTGLELITTVTCSSGGTASNGVVTVGSTVSSVVVATAFSSTYDNYKIVIESLGQSASGNYMRISLNNITTNVWYGNGFYQTAGTGTLTGFHNTGTSYEHIGVGDPDSSAVIELLNPFAIKKKFIYSSFSSGGTSGYNGTTAGNAGVTTSCTGFTISLGAGTMTGGTISVYGYRK